MFTVSDLEGKRVRREDGEILGHVFEAHVESGQLKALICGARGVLQRLSASRAGRRVPWDQVLKVTSREILVRGGGSRRAG